jgi:DNA-binding response OmpR family regulator
VDDVTRGFDIGCDDYIRKPFALKELLVRIEVIFKREYRDRGSIIDLNNGFSFDMENMLLTYENKLVNIRTKELKLLSFFLKNSDKLLSYNQIYSELWEYDEMPSHGSLRAYINTIRNIVGKEKIENIRHTGYRYVA